MIRAPPAAAMIRGIDLRPPAPGISRSSRMMSTWTRLQRLDGVFGGPGDGDDLEIVVAFDHARQDGPGDHRIVDDHQPDASAWGSRRVLAVPRSGERPLHVG